MSDQRRMRPSLVNPSILIWRSSGQRDELANPIQASDNPVTAKCIRIGSAVSALPGRTIEAATAYHWCNTPLDIHVGAKTRVRCDPRRRNIRTQNQRPCLFASTPDAFRLSPSSRKWSRIKGRYNSTRNPWESSAIAEVAS